MYQVKNISGGLLVCTLADKATTLRVNNKAVESVTDAQMTQHIFNLEKRKLVKLTHTEDKKTTPVSAVETAKTKKEG